MVNVRSRSFDVEHLETTIQQSLESVSVARLEVDVSSLARTSGRVEWWPRSRDCSRVADNSTEYETDHPGRELSVVGRRYVGTRTKKVRVVE
jgi:hypothetical protein